MVLKLLIVDDEKLDREGLSRQLNWESFGIQEVYTAKNGLEALTCIASVNPDILITDIKMPGMNGIALFDSA